jgi:hypothetical protein
MRDVSFIFADIDEFSKPRNLHVVGLCLTSGYLITDSLMMLISVIDMDTVPDQWPYYLHNAGVILTIQTALYLANFNVVVLSLLIQLAMIVSIFLNIRWLLYQHN